MFTRNPVSAFLSVSGLMLSQLAAANPVQVSVAGGSATEGSTMPFIFSLSAASTQAQSVDYELIGNTALAGVDFTAIRGTLTFNPGETFKILYVQTLADLLTEGNELCTLVLSNPTSGFALASLKADGTIKDPVATTPPSTGTGSGSGSTGSGSTGSGSTGSGTTTGSNTGTGSTNTHLAATAGTSTNTWPMVRVEATRGFEGSDALFRVHLNQASTNPVTVSYATENGTAIAGSDYQAVSGELEFAPGETSKFVRVALLADGLSESTETLALRIRNPINADLVTTANLAQLNLVDQNPVSLASQVLTQVKIQSTEAGVTQTQVPVSFGQVFKMGDLPQGYQLQLQDAAGQNLPTQFEVKARHQDGSVRHAVISSLLPSLGSSQTLSLVRIAGAVAPAPALDKALLVQQGFDTRIQATIAGVSYSASAKELLTSLPEQTWLQGPLATEWLVSAPLKTSAGVAHPHLQARFAIRTFPGYQSARVSVTLENNWAFEAAPSNQTYDLSLSVGNQQVLSQTGLQHYHHARWHQSLWWGTEAKAEVAYDPQYLLATGAVPNYDLSLAISEAGLSEMATTLAKPSVFGLMKIGQVNAGMSTTGARPEIGPMPRWSARWLISQDVRAKRFTVAMGEQAGTWSIHYRDKGTDLPVSITHYPYMSLQVSGKKVDPLTKIDNAFPACGSAGCTTPNAHDTSHQPSFAYLPYLLTGDLFFLEEQQFWTNFNVMQANYAYRGYAAGLFNTDQVRGQAWSLRTLAQTAYITPDDHPLKAYFETQLNNNRIWYQTNYSDKAAQNPLGYINPLAYGFVISPWMDDFFTWSVGYLVEMGFSDWQPMLEWKARFPVGRMTDPEFCPILASSYWLYARDGDIVTQKPLSTTYYQTFGELYRGALAIDYAGRGLENAACGSQDMANILNAKLGRSMIAGELIGYAGGGTGYPANLQPALAVAYSTGVANAQSAWQKFRSTSVQIKFGDEVQFAIVPKNP